MLKNFNKSNRRRKNLQMFKNLKKYWEKNKEESKPSQNFKNKSKNPNFGLKIKKKIKNNYFLKYLKKKRNYSLTTK